MTESEVEPQTITLVLSLDTSATILAAIRSALHQHGLGTKQFNRLTHIESELARVLDDCLLQELNPPSDTQVQTTTEAVPERVAGHRDKGGGW